jgi:hypothetical protein
MQKEHRVEEKWTWTPDEEEEIKKLEERLKSVANLPCHPHMKSWESFSNEVFQHIHNSLAGYYKVGPVEPMDYFTSHFGVGYLAGQVSKYMARVERTRRLEDLYKAAHYLSRLHQKLLEATPSQHVEIGI